MCGDSSHLGYKELHQQFLNAVMNGNKAISCVNLQLLKLFNLLICNAQYSSTIKNNKFYRK